MIADNRSYSGTCALFSVLMLEITTVFKMRKTDWEILTVHITPYSFRPLQANFIFILCFIHFPYASYIFMFGGLSVCIYQQDLPAAVTEEELDRHLHLKEFDERPYMFVAGSAYDG